MKAFIALLFFIAYIYCSDPSCSMSSAAKDSRRVLSGPSSTCHTPIVQHGHPFYTGYACQSGVELQSIFDGATGPITEKQLEKSVSTFARGKKGCEYCVIDCTPTVYNPKPLNTGGSYNQLLTGCDKPYYAYSCVQPNVTQTKTGISFTVNSNCKHHSSLTTQQIFGVLDLCTKFNGCTFNKALTQEQVLDAFHGKNKMQLLSTAGRAISYDKKSNAVISLPAQNKRSTHTRIVIKKSTKKK
ncbi:hypothetical protein AKO1_010157 [Acrasis kona]|uniref:Uncharacterized protein n=1 Tax=Acrasis kona TaxID=1008807 RepID=A0AAW2ZQJ9_9EUKA